MSHPNADKVADALSSSHRGESFQYETDLIQSMQKNCDPTTFSADIAQINDRVNMRSLGFPEDFKIVSVSSDNRVTTTSEDGMRTQIRDGRTLDIQQEYAGVIPPATAAGDRNFVTQTDGSAKYTVKSGDTLWSITKEVLARQNKGQSNEDIDATYRKIAELNNITNPNRIGVGQELKIPSPATEGVYPVAKPETYTPGTYTPGALTSFSPNLKPAGEGVFNPMAAAGLPGGDDGYVYSRTKTGIDNIGGNQRTAYTGWIRDSSLGLNGNNTKFDANEVTDAYGRIISRHIDYSNANYWFKNTGASMKFDRGFGAPMELGVKSVDTLLTANGTYESTIRTDDGRVFNSITDSTGKVLKFYQA